MADHTRIELVSPARQAGRDPSRVMIRGETRRIRPDTFRLHRAGLYIELETPQNVTKSCVSSMRWCPAEDLDLDLAG